MERPFFYLEKQFIKGTRFASLSHLLEELAAFEREDLDVRVHTTTQERPIDRIDHEQPHLTPLPDHRFVGTLAMSPKVSWDCLVSYQDPLTQQWRGATDEEIGQWMAEVDP